MKFSILAYATVLVFLCLSCSKPEDQATPENEQNTEANYAESKYTVYKGDNFSSSSLSHKLPEGTTFAIRSIKNTAGKTSSAFTNTFQTGAWSTPVDKSTDITLQSILAKYKTENKTGVSIDPKTGIITILGLATQNLPLDSYSIDLTASYNGTTTILENVVKFEIKDRNINTYTKAKWKYATEAAYTQAEVSTNLLSGTILSETSAKISGYNSNRTYLRLKIADARNIGINLNNQINFDSEHNLQAINPWITNSIDDDAIILSSAIDRFPVLEQDSILRGTVSGDFLYNGKAINIELALNIKTAGIYDVNVQLKNHSTQNGLLWPRGKAIYRPTALRNNNFENSNSTWSNERMYWSDNFVVYWQKGLGNTLSEVESKVNIKNMLANMENSYEYFYTTMKFVNTANTKANANRIYVMLHDQSEWLATASGYDFEIGATWINYTAANSNATMTHEIGHVFQYLNSCDGKYAFTGQQYNYIGTFWEQTAQYQATLLFPTSQFSYIPAFIEKTHLNLLHEDNRYSNFYYLQYWHKIHGVEFVGQIWQKATAGQDAVEAYKTVTSTSQSEFNNQIYEYAKRTLTWDFLHKTSYNSYILSSSSVNTHKTTTKAVSDGYHQIDATKCVQNYGFNALRLSVPATSTSVEVSFQGLKGASGYNNSYDQYAGWRWGFVAISSSGEATYGNMNTQQTGTAQFTIPANTSRLYFLVTGAPTQHFHHAWDDNPNNDEQYPWKAKFENSNPI